MSRPPSTLQHFSLIAQSNSAVLSILMSDFLFQLTSSFVRGEVHNREEGEMARKSREEGEIGAEMYGGGRK